MILLDLHHNRTFPPILQNINKFTAETVDIISVENLYIASEN
jgi:hypothetical protein